MVVGSPHSQEIPQWFAMRVTYKRELAVKDLLDAQGVESFIPMHKVVRQLRGRKKWSLEPVVHNLLFVHACKSWLQQFKVKLPHLQYMTQRSDGKNHPIVVRDEEMQRFMEVTRTYDEQLLFFKTEELDLAKGTKVRIHGGPFDGVEGTFMKVKGKRNRRVVIAIQNVIAVAMAYVEPDFIEVIK